MLAAVLVSGCSASGGSATTAGPPAPSASPAGCPAVADRGARWPAQVPADLPVPPTADLGAPAQQAPGGLTLVRFTTRRSVRDGVVFLAGALQPAGFELGRGDAEAAEADVPFSRGHLRGVLKMSAEGPCRTRWVLALATRRVGAAEPALLPRGASAGSPSPLPFG